jgi:hypothetical protein
MFTDENLFHQIHFLESVIILIIFKVFSIKLGKPGQLPQDE